MGRALVELDFQTVDGSPTLERVRFQPRTGASVVESFRGDRFGQVGLAFSWTKALRALCLLLVRHASGMEERTTLVGGAKSPARTLFNLLEHPERSAAAIPFSTPDGVCHLSALLERANPGSGPSGQRRHWIAVRPERLPSQCVSLRLDGYVMTAPERIQALARDLAAAWPAESTEASDTVAPLSKRSSTAPSPLADTTTWNDCVSRFYHHAFSGDVVEAASAALAECVSGELHLAFTASREQEIRFATSAGSSGRQFLLATMGAASSHPLIYRCKGRVRAISDILDARGWHGRAMYQLAKPHLRFEDALGTDLHLEAKGRVFSLCVIRDRRSFDPQERSAMALLTPHLRNALRHSPRPGSERIRVLALGEATTRPRVALGQIRDQLHAVLPPLAANESHWLPKLETWHRRLSRGHLVSPLSITTGQEKDGGPSLQCLPPTAGSPAAIVALAPQ